MPPPPPLVISLCAAAGRRLLASCIADQELALKRPGRSRRCLQPQASKEGETHSATRRKTLATDRRAILLADNHGLGTQPARGGASEPADQNGSTIGTSNRQESGWKQPLFQASRGTGASSPWPAHGCSQALLTTCMLALVQGSPSTRSVLALGGSVALVVALTVFRREIAPVRQC